MKTYYYYDGPRLFSCEDAQGQKYIGFWVDATDKADIYLYFPVSAQHLADVETGKMALADFMASADWAWEAREILYSDQAHVRKLDASQIPKDCFPDPGITLSEKLAL